MAEKKKTKRKPAVKRKIRECDCCGSPAKYVVSDEFYKYLCEDCFERYENEHDYSWDENNF